MKQKTELISQDKIWSWLEEVTDPEIPVLNVVEMGIVRDVKIDEDQVTVKITPTYSGCPAMNAIEMAIHQTLKKKGIGSFKILTDYKETWTTDWMTDEAKLKLKEYGIAPPDKTDADSEDYLIGLKNSQKVVPCPYCESTETEASK
ncbi:MAG: 1,2-phenylacetyl-CoA epoxidase subunit PaaD [Balneolaceae bacterium]|nr:1,2-phenylacetyl-CoA epoxidase subunit PaaD [Balneolaceae bacterium]